MWRRLNPQYLSHITRQGFRDHIGNNHQGGHLEFHTGFTSATQDDRRLLTPYAVLGLRDLTDQSIISFLEKTVYPKSSDLSEAQKSFDQQVNYDYWTGTSMFGDKSAVHFGWQRVEDKDYGCERNNEVFYIYPTDAIASQYDFSFHNATDGNFTKNEPSSYNDLHVYPKDMNKPSIPIDSGIVFLPKSTMVDPVTGSKYASEEIESDGKKNRKLIVNETLVHSFNKWALTLNQPESPLKKTLISYNELDINRRTELQQAVERNLIDELQKLGFPSDVVQDLANETFGIFQSSNNSDVQHDLDLLLRKTGAMWKRAENTIQAQEYWNQYFAIHESERPKHIYFYDGDPTIAVFSFQRDNKIGNEKPENGVTSSFKEELPNQKPQNEHLLGFDDHLVQNNSEDERVLKGRDELLSSGVRLIEKHYSQTKP